MIYVTAAIVIAIGAFAVCRPTAIRDFALRLSRSDFERRLYLAPSYVGSLRLVGAGSIAFGAYIFIVHLNHALSK